MRRPFTARPALRATAAVVALGLTLAACSGDAETEPSASPSASESAPAGDIAPSAEDIAALEGVVVEGDAGAEPTITLPSTPFTVSAPVARVVDEGSGEEIAEGDLIELHSVWFNGSDGAKTASSWEAGAPERLGASRTLVAQLADIVIGGKVGTRFVFASPGGEEGASLAVGEIVARTDGRAKGTAVEPKEGLPTVTLSESGEPSIEAVGGDAPTELVVQPLIEGEGPEVQAGQTVTVQYSGWLWTDGTLFDSSWKNGAPFDVTDVGQGQVIAGWNEGLVGQKVGSQVMLVIPPDKGYGDQEAGAIPPNSTLVFVVDVLAAS